MDILVSLIAEVAGYTIEPIGRQAGYLLFYKSNFEKLADHFKELEGERVRINHCIEEERKNGKEIESDVLNWLEKVDELFERANQLQDDPRVGCFGCLFPNLVLRHQLSRKAVKISEEFIQLHEKGNFNKIGYELAPDEVAFSCNTTRGGGEKLETRESFKEEILKALKDPNVSNVGVYGLGGVGKTTLVEEVARIAKQEKMFDVVVKAHVSEAPRIETIQKQIAEMLGLHFGDATDAGRVYLLRHRIKAEKTILVILDDIWTRLDLEKVGIPSGDEHNGFKLLMTSRNEDVLLQMGIQKNYAFRLELLNEAEAWSLFQSMVGDMGKGIRLQNIATQVAKKCAGLPLGIAALAGTLRGQAIDVWEDALSQLERFDHEEHDAKIYFVLELSYKSLKSQELKAFFLLFAVVSDIFDYYLIIGMGLGIFRGLHTMTDARIRLRRIIASLKASCLLLEDNSTKVIKMHDIVREVAVSIASRDEHVFVVKPEDEFKEWPTYDFLKNCSQIILQQCHLDELPQRLDCPCIKVFVLESLDRSLKIPDTFFEGMGSLEVLDLTHFNFSLLPNSFKSLINLKALLFYFCVLENVDAIRALESLEFLTIWKSSMNKLPNEIGKLTKIRMLDLSHSGIEVIPSNIISSLTKLEELKMGNTSIKWEHPSSSNQNEKASLVELRKLSNLTALELHIQEAWILPRELQLTFEKLTRYKIAIGDIWEWSDIEDAELNTLMLKLVTNIHLEHGIKTLIKGVENLYLDELGGVQNVLYQMNCEGFPLLKHLNIRNNEKIKHIVDSVKRNQVWVSFPNLETIVLQNIKNLEQICHGPLVVNSFGNLSVIKVKNCIQLKYLLSFSTVKGLAQLSEIEVCQCSSMKEIVYEGNNSSANDMTDEKVEFVSLRFLTLDHLKTLDNFYSHGGMHQRVENSVSALLFSFQVAFPNLDTLKLSSLNLNKIWDENPHSLEKLSNLIVENCGGLKYLFSSTIVQSIKSLKRLEISNCHLMEEIIAIEGINNGTGSALEEVGFFKLEKVILKDMKNLNRIWYTQFKKLKMLQVNNCEKIVVVFSSSMQKSYHNLEVLEVTNCALVEGIFELTSPDNSTRIEDTIHMKRITLDGLPKLKKIWSEDPNRILGFGNLENVNVKSCHGLEYLFPFYVARCCSNLKELDIKYCRNMKEIIAENKEDIGTAPIFDFNQLNTLLLWGCIKLKSFFEGNHTIECASLRKIDVTYCPQLVLFKTLSPTSPERLPDGRLPILMQQPPFILEQVIPNLEWLRLNNTDADMMILQAQNLGVLFTKLTYLGLCDYMNEDASFPYWILHNVHTLESLVIEWSSFRKIFQDNRPVSEKIHTRLKKLSLYQLPHLQHVCEEGSSIDQVLEVLEYLYVKHCHSLTKLLPSSVTFNHLKKLEIDNCNGLINLITSSTAQSLVKLIILKVKNCDSIEEIITDEQNVDIAFISMQILILESLPRLSKFCSGNCILKFPMLKEVVLRECPRMELFCEGDTKTPILRKVKIANDDEKTHWKGNLNDTVKNMFEDKVSFYSFEHLKLFEYPELKESWYNQLQCNVFRSLKYLVVHKCDFLSDVLFQSNLLELLMNLEELDVKDCESLEAVFDLKGESTAGQNPMKNSSQLKKLTLFNLPKLRHVWKEDPGNTLRFQNLCEISVMECKSLISLIPLSIARDIVKLQNLHVCKCGVEEIVANEEGIEEIINFMFPNLVSLGLNYLPKLNALFAGEHSLQCKSLKSIEVFRCPKFQLFKTQAMRHQERATNAKLNFTMYQPLFVIEELLSSVENLTLNSKDYDMIVQSQHSRVQFNNLKHLTMSRFYNEEITFPYSFLENIPNLESLVVNSCSFIEIFEGEQVICMKKKTQIRPQLKKLNLWNLDKLQGICKEGLQIDPILQLLESINVYMCSSLVKLVPSSISFNCLTDLEVTYCHGLINLITLSTAKSLVKLTRMKIEACHSLEDVVNGNEEEVSSEVTFCCLQSLELISLPRLRQFCSCVCPIEFLLLEEVIVRECPRMEFFSLGETSTPSLQCVQTEENDNEHRWSGDLNGTIKDMFDDKIAFCKFQNLALSDYPELKGLWYGQIQHNLFCNLKSLTVLRCDFLPHVLLSYNVMQVLHGLQDLEVRDCDSLEAVFDVKGVKHHEKLIKQSTQLKGITLSDLPNLKHIWNEDPCEIISFENLCWVDVSMCQNLLNIFSLSLCQDVGHLEMLSIMSCGVEEIVGMKEQSTENVIFSFPRLTQLRLFRLTKLKSFYPEKHTLECSSLKTLNVYQCEVLRMFSFDHLDFQQCKPLNDDIHDIPSGQAPFSFEMLISNLEQLAINATDALRLVKGSSRQESVYRNIKFLGLQCFDETPSNFVNDFHVIFPSLEIVQVRNSSFETLFPTKGSLQVSKPIQKLWLYELENLKNIWQEDFPLSHPLLQDLEELNVRDCQSLISLAPSRSSFTNLTSLEVNNCKGLVYLITSSTAKSLVKLTRLQIKNCEKMLDVVKIDEENGDIMFKNLEYLEFTSLSSLRSFCYGKHTFMFPSLIWFVVKGCPQMKIFSSEVTIAPCLTSILVEDQKMRWKGDLNLTIQQLFREQQVKNAI